MTTPPAAVTAWDVVGMLRRHYLPDGRPPGGLFADEVESPCGHRRGDALWLPLTSHGGGLVGHEVKVSRADVAAELADPTKADAWARYCERWWLTVSDAALVDGLTIPDAWGVMAPPSGRRTRTMTVLREAPLLKPTSPDPAYRRLTAWYFYRTHTTIESVTRERDRLRQALARERAAHDQTRAASGNAHSPHAHRVAGILTAVERGARDASLWGGVSDDTIVAAIVDHEAVERATDDARRAIDQLIRTTERACEPMARVREDLKAARATLPGT